MLSTAAFSAGIIALSIVCFSGYPQAQAPAPPPPPQAGHPSGKLVIWGDTAIFINPTDPNNCILTSRFRRGERVGFRMTAIDGGTGEVEQTAVLRQLAPARLIHYRPWLTILKVSGLRWPMDSPLCQALYREIPLPI